MKICISGSEEDKNVISDSLLQVSDITLKELELHLYSDYDDLVYKGSKDKFDVIFVTADNATGMEGVIASKKIFPELPVIWLSNDNGFGAQPYRLGVSYFHAKPITAKVLEKAIKTLA